MAARLISKARAAGESALRTFLQAAVPAAVGAWQLSHQLDQTVVATGLIAGVSAVIAAGMRVAKPIQTDAPGVAVVQVTSDARNL
jgi:hypothetical protein